MLYEISTIAALGNVLLLLILLYIFIQNYRKIPSSFTFGLVIFASILLVDSLFSCSAFLPSLITQFIPHQIHTLPPVLEFIALVVLISIVIK